MSTTFAGAAPEPHPNQPRVSALKRIVAGWIDYFIFAILAVPACVAEVLALSRRGETLGVTYFVLWGLTILLCAAYILLLLAMLASKGSSPGSTIFGYRIHKDGSARQGTGWGTAALRLFIGAIASVLSLCCGLGPIILAASIAVARDGRGLHDRMCNTEAVPRDGSAPAPESGAGNARPISSFDPAGTPASANEAAAASFGTAPGGSPSAVDPAAAAAPAAAASYSWDSAPQEDDGSTGLRPDESKAPAWNNETPAQEQHYDAWAATAPAQWEPATQQAQQDQEYLGTEPGQTDPVSDDSRDAGSSAFKDDIFGSTDNANSDADWEPEPTELITPPSAEDDATDAPTVMRSTPASPGITIVFDDGTALDVNDGDTAVVGRNPQADEGVKALSYLDETRSMSKTHAFVTLADGVLTIRDAGSTNGSAVVHDDGTETVITSEGSETVRVGAHLRFGDRVATIKERTA